MGVRLQVCASDVAPIHVWMPHASAHDRHGHALVVWCLASVGFLRPKRMVEVRSGECLLCGHAGFLRFLEARC